MTAAGAPAPTRQGAPASSQPWERLRTLAGPAVYLGCLTTLAAATGVALAAHAFGLAHVSLILLGAVIVNAILWGLWPSLFSVAVSNGIAAFLFYPPIYDFRVFAREDLVDLVVFTAVAFVTSQLASSLRWHVVESERRNAVAAELASFSRELGAIADADELYVVAIERLEVVIGGRVLILLPQGQDFVVLAARLQDNPLPSEVMAAGKSLLRAAKDAAAAAEMRTVTGWRLRVLRTWRGPVGILAVAPEVESSYTLDHLAPVLDQAASAIERTLLARAIEEGRLRRAREDLQEALIGSMSHSLQTPLASIIGSITSLQDPATRRNEPAAVELTSTIREEAERLERFVGKILQMTRIRAGALAPRLELVELPDIINAALLRLRRVLAKHRLDMRLPPDLPMLLLDLFLMEEAIANLLENAAKYAPAGTAIRVAATVAGQTLTLEIADEGTGLDPAALPRLFDPFFRAGAVDGKAPGTGLGLAICRAFVAANDGSVEALAPQPDHPGAVFRIHLPVPPQPAARPELGRDE